MSRPLRITYKNAWYHVINRGANRKLIFHHDRHRNVFLELLSEITIRYNARIHAYCLMDNHYHLLLQTPSGNLPRIMRHLNGVYTQKFNRINNQDGPLFRGRYKAILIEEGVGLLQVSRYIHLNPANAGLDSKIKQPLWSSLGCYLGKYTPSVWLKKDTVLSFLNSKNTEKAYADFIEEGNDKDTKIFYSRKKLQSIFGGEVFKEKKILEFDKDQLIESTPDFRAMELRPSISSILNHVANYYQISSSTLFLRKRGAQTVPRHMAITISQKAYGYKLQEITNVMFNIKPSSISNITKRFVAKMKYDKNMIKKYQHVLKSIGENHNITKLPCLSKSE